MLLEPILLVGSGQGVDWLRLLLQAVACPRLFEAHHPEQRGAKPRQLHACLQAESEQLCFGALAVMHLKFTTCFSGRARRLTPSHEFPLSHLFEIQTIRGRSPRLDLVWLTQDQAKRGGKQQEASGEGTKARRSLGRTNRRAPEHRHATLKAKAAEQYADTSPPLLGGAGGRRPHAPGLAAGRRRLQQAEHGESGLCLSSCAAIAASLTHADSTMVPLASQQTQGAAERHRREETDLVHAAEEEQQAQRAQRRAPPAGRAANVIRRSSLEVGGQQLTQPRWLATAHTSRADKTHQRLHLGTGEPPLARSLYEPTSFLPLLSSSLLPLPLCPPVACPADGGAPVKDQPVES